MPKKKARKLRLEIKKLLYISPLVVVVFISLYLYITAYKAVSVETEPAPIETIIQNPTSTPTVSPSTKPKSKLTPYKTPTPIKTSTPTPTPTTSNPTNTPTPTPTRTPTPTPTSTSTPTPTPTATPTTEIVPTVRIISPNGGETYTEGDMVNITWEATGTFLSFALQYSSCPSCASNIASVNGNLRSYNWKVSVGNTSGTQFKIRIVSYPTNYEGPNPIDYSDGDLTIYQNPACDTGCP